MFVPSFPRVQLFIQMNASQVLRLILIPGDRAADVAPTNPVLASPGLVLHSHPSVLSPAA